MDNREVLYLTRPGISPILAWFTFFHVLFWICRVIFPFSSQTYRTLNFEKKCFWSASVVSTIHAIIISLFAAKIVFFNTEQPNFSSLHGSNIFTKSSESSIAITIFLGYLLSDLLLAIYFRNKWSGWIANIVHHIAIIIVWGQFYYGNFGHYFATISYFLEITTPFVNQRWFFYESGMKSYQIYFYNGLLLTFLWFCTRIVLYTFLGYKVMMQHHQWNLIGVLRQNSIYMCYLIGLSLQYLWFYKLVIGSLKFLRKKQKAEKESKD
eukprot:maker-scaffold_5-snap-gene-3.40-mRNA-1 protein AED:0.00 eAED:0.00 QI:158/1/1/1/0/0/2/1068/265